MGGEVGQSEQHVFEYCAGFRQQVSKSSTLEPFPPSEFCSVFILQGGGTDI